MGRIRTYKPSLFTHGDLFDAEIETGLPLRLAFLGLFTSCDREGRFKWRPREIKLEVLPHDEIDFSRVLDALVTRGFVLKYACAGVIYGCIPTWHKHQVINNREMQSEIPSFNDADEIFSIESITSTRESRVIDASPTRDSRALRGREGKGREEEGKGREEENPVCNDASILPSEKKQQKKESNSAETWQAYCNSYLDRYRTEPVRNASVNAKVSQFVKRLGCDEAPLVAAFYVSHNSGFYVRQMHDVGLMLKDAEKLRTEWATNTRMTATKAMQTDKTQTNLDAFGPLIAEAEARERENA